MCLRYSSSVVAPTQCNSPRASAGFSMLEASIAPSALPAPTSVCSSSMKRTISPAAAVISDSTALRRSSNSPRNLAPAMSAPRSSESRRLFFNPSGTSPLTMRKASPSTIAVLPTLGSPRQHLNGAADLLVATDHRIELALAGDRSEVARIFLQCVVTLFGRSAIGMSPLAQILDRAVEALGRQPGVGQRLRRAGALGERQREQQPFNGDETVARLLGELFRLLEQASGFGRQKDLAGTLPLDARQLRQLGVGGAQR